MPSGEVDKETLCGRLRTRRGRGSSDVRRRHGNMRTQAPGNFKPGSSPSSWSSGPALGRTSSPHPQPYPVSAKWADARAPRAGLSPSGPQHVGVRSAPEVAAAANAHLTAHRVILLHPEPRVRPHGPVPAALSRRNSRRPEPGSPLLRRLRHLREAGASRRLTKPPPPGRVSACPRFAKLGVPRRRSYSPV